MSADPSTGPVADLAELRRHTVARSLAALADVLRHQHDAECGLVNAERALRRETDRVADPAAGDAQVEAYAAWLPAGRRRIADAQAALDAASVQVAQARAALALARAMLRQAGAAQASPPESAVP